MVDKTAPEHLPLGRYWSIGCPAESMGNELVAELRELLGDLRTHVSVIGNWSTFALRAQELSRSLPFIGGCHVRVEPSPV